MDETAPAGTPNEARLARVLPRLSPRARLVLVTVLACAGVLAMFVLGDFTDLVDKDRSASPAATPVASINSTVSVNAYMNRAAAQWAQWKKYTKGLPEGVGTSVMNCEADIRGLSSTIEILQALPSVDPEIEGNVLDYFRALQVVASECVATSRGANKMSPDELSRRYDALQEKWTLAHQIALARGWTGSCADKGTMEECG